MNINNLSLREKISQMFIIPIGKNGINDNTLKLIKEYKIGGFILYKKNYNNYEEMLNTINKLKKINNINQVPLFIAIDQEGGRVNRMPSEINNILSANKIAKTNKIELIKESTKITSKILKETGININFAPVLDIKRFENDHPIGDRCYSNNPEIVSKFGIEAMKEYQKNGIISVIKHFPGHGTTQKDSHFKIPIVQNSIEELEQKDIIPFKNAIDNNAEVIMISHILLKDIDKKYPSSLSTKVIGNYLRNKYNFKGLVVTDDLKMLAIRLRYSKTKATEYSITAGSNMIILGYEAKDIIKVINNIELKIKKGKIDINKIDDSVTKILKIKEKYNINDDNKKGINIENINKEIDNINKKILECIK